MAYLLSMLDLTTATVKPWDSYKETLRSSSEDLPANMGPMTSSMCPAAAAAAGGWGGDSGDCVHEEEEVEKHRA